MKNILLTGSGGFIGSHLKLFLDGDYNLFTPRSFELNLLNKAELKKYIEQNNIEFIIHSASCGARITPEATIEEVAKPNIDMFKNLADLNIPMISIGSGAEYDKSKSIINVKEIEFGESIPKDPYGYSKYLISKEIEKRENILNLRLFGIYGVREDKSRVTSCIINSNINHQPIILNQNVRFHFIYIDDFCKIVKHFILNKSSEKFLNVAPTKSIEIIEMAQIVNNFSDYESEIIINNEGLNKEYTANNTLLLKELGEFDFTNYKTGLKKMYDLIKN